MKYRIPANWTDDCQGKQDFDGVLVRVSTRYWPCGGGFHVFHQGTWEGNEARPEILPSAHASFYLSFTNKRDEHRDVRLIQKDFEGETEAEVKAKVEVWTQHEYEKICTALLEVYRK